MKRTGGERRPLADIAKLRRHNSEPRRSQHRYRVSRSHWGAKPCWWIPYGLSVHGSCQLLLYKVCACISHLGLRFDSLTSNSSSRWFEIYWKWLVSDIYPTQGLNMWSWDLQRSKIPCFRSFWDFVFLNCFFPKKEANWTLGSENLGSTFRE